MDPLSVTASVVGFLSFVVGAIDYFNHVKKAPEERKALIERLRQIEVGLQSIQQKLDFARRIRHDTSTGTFGAVIPNDSLFLRFVKVEEPGGHSRQLKELLDRLFDNEFREEISKRRRLWWRASYKFTKDDFTGKVDDVVEKVRQLREYLADDMDEMQMTGFAILKGLQRSNQEDEILKILEWISPAAQQPTELIASMQSSLARTSTDFVSEELYQQWTSDTGARSWHLSCFGKPGVGKSHRSRAVICDLWNRFQHQGIPVLFVLFNDQNQSQSLRTVYCALLRQSLIQRDPIQIPQDIREIWDQSRLEGNPGSTQLPGLTQHQAKSLLTKELKSYDQQKFIVVDALDEAGESAKSIHRALSDLRRDLQASIFTTTRQDPRVSYDKSRECDRCGIRLEGLHWQCKECRGRKGGIFDCCKNCYQTLGCLNAAHEMRLPGQIYVEISPTHKEIEVFVDVSLKQELELDDSRDEDRDRYTSYRPMLRRIQENLGPQWASVPGKICRAAGNSYLIADLVIKRLKSQVSPQSTLAMLNGLSEYSEDRNQEIYNAQYAEMLDLCIGQQETDEQKLAYQYLSMTACAKHWLTFDQIYHAIAIRRGEQMQIDDDTRIDIIQRVRQATKGLLSFSGFGSPGAFRVGFFHQTLAAYMREHGSNRFPDAHDMLFKSSLAYLRLDIFQQPFRLNEIEEQLKDYPFAPYAACYWGEHLREKSLTTMDDLIPVLEVFNEESRMETILQVAMYEFTHTDHAWDSSGTVTPLHVCAYFGLVQLCQILIDGGQDVDAQESTRGQTPLHYAARRGHDLAVRFLLSKGANPNIVSVRGYTPLMEAIESSRIDVVERMVSVPSVNVNTHGEAAAGRTALVLAAELGKPELLKKLLSRDDIDINKPANKNFTALTMAVKCCNVQCVKQLLDRPEIDLSICDESVGTSLDNVALTCGSKGEAGLKVITEMFLSHSRCPKMGVPAIRWLIEFDANTIMAMVFQAQMHASWEDEYGQTLMHIAARSANAKGLELVYNYVSQVSSFDVSAEDKYGNTPLHAACSNFAADKGKAAQFLLTRRAAPLVTNYEGLTPLDMAHQCSPGREWSEVVDLFKPYFHGNQKPPSNAPPASLERIVRLGNERALKSFLEHAPDKLVLKEDPYTGFTALHRTMDMSRANLLRLILPRAIQYVDATSKNLRTALHVAGQRGCSGGIELLLDAGADPDLKDSSGDTAFEIAINSPNSVASCLLLINAKANLPSPRKIPKDLLHNAVAKSNVDAVQRLIDAGVDITHRKLSKGPTPLMVARNNLQATIGKAKNDMNADPNRTTAVSQEAFYAPVFNLPQVKQCQRIVEILQQAEANIANKRNNSTDAAPTADNSTKSGYRDLTDLINHLKGEQQQKAKIEEDARLQRALGITAHDPVRLRSGIPTQSASADSHAVKSHMSRNDTNPPTATSTESHNNSSSQKNVKFGLEKEERIAVIVMLGVVIVACFWLSLHYQTQTQMQIPRSRTPDIEERLR